MRLNIRHFFADYLWHSDAPAEWKRPLVGYGSPEEELQCEGVQPPRGDVVCFAGRLHYGPHAMPVGNGKSSSILMMLSSFQSLFTSGDLTGKESNLLTIETKVQFAHFIFVSSVRTACTHSVIALALIYTYVGNEEKCKKMYSE